MKEIPHGEPAESILNELVVLDSRIKELERIKDRFKLKPDELNTLTNKRNQRIIDVLLVKGLLPITIKLSRFPGEQIHPFSENSFSIENPIINLGSNISAIRRDQIITDSVTAEELLKPYEEVPETKDSFLLRTMREIQTVQDEKKTGKAAKLRRLEDRLVIDRLLKLKLNSASRNFGLSISENSSGIRVFAAYKGIKVSSYLSRGRVSPEDIRVIERSLQVIGGPKRNDPK